MLVGQIRWILRPQVMRGRVDVHRHEREEPDVRLVHAQPLVPRPAELARLRPHVGAERAQQRRRHPQPADEQDQEQLPPAVGAAQDYPPAPVAGVRHGLHRRGQGQMHEPSFGGDGQRRQDPPTPGPADQQDHNAQIRGEGDEEIGGVGPRPVGDRPLDPVQRPHGCAQRHPQAGESRQSPAGSGGEPGQPGAAGAYGHGFDGGSGGGISRRSSVSAPSCGYKVSAVVGMHHIHTGRLGHGWQLYNARMIAGCGSAVPSQKLRRVPRGSKRRRCRPDRRLPASTCARGAEPTRHKHQHQRKGFDVRAWVGGQWR